MSIANPQSQEQVVPPGAMDNVNAENLNIDLPPFGTISDDLSTHSQAWNYLSFFARESHDGDWDEGIKDAASNAKIYEDGYDPKPGDDAVTANEIQGIVVAITDIQTREPLTVIIKPVETRGKPEVYWIGPPVDAQVAMLTGLPIGLGMTQVPMSDPMTGQQAIDETGQPVMGMAPAQTYDPLDEMTSFIVRRAASTGTFPIEWLCVLDDKLLADIYQTVFDLMWMESGIDDFIYSNVLMTNIYGYQTAYYGWDARTKLHIVDNISIKEVYLDRSKMELDRMRMQMFEMVMNVDQAKAFYPQLTNLIEAYARKGTPRRIDSYTDFGIGNDRDFKHRTVTLRTAFVGNQELPMTEVEAMDKGLVFRMQAQDGSQELHLSDSGWQHTTGADAMGNVQEDGTLPPGQWPTTIGIRQLATLNETQRIVQDIRCEHACAPLLLNVSIPLPGKPEGQGIPKKLKSMQAADIRLLTAMVRYAESFANPGSIIPESVAQALETGMKRAFIDPTISMRAPDNLIEKFGEKCVLWFKPPPMPDAVPQTIELMRQKRQESSGRPDAAQGISPTENASGRMVEALQQGATSQFGFQAQWTRKMVQRLARLMHYSHLWRLDLQDMMKIYSRLPEPIMEKAIEKARMGKWDIAADVSNGTAGMSDKKLKRAVALFNARSQTGEPAMSLTTFREELGLDAEQESVRWRQEQGMVGSGQPQQQQPPSNGNGQQQPSGNGNGRFNGG